MNLFTIILGIVPFVDDFFHLEFGKKTTGARIIIQDSENSLDDGSKIEKRLVIIFRRDFFWLGGFFWLFFLLPFFLSVLP